MTSSATATTQEETDAILLNLEKLLLPKEGKNWMKTVKENMQAGDLRAISTEAGTLKLYDVLWCTKVEDPTKPKKKENSKHNDEDEEDDDDKEDLCKWRKHDLYFQLPPMPLVYNIQAKQGKYKHKFCQATVQVPKEHEPAFAKFGKSLAKLFPLNDRQSMKDGTDSVQPVVFLEERKKVNVFKASVPFYRSDDKLAIPIIQSDGEPMEGVDTIPEGTMVRMVVTAELSYGPKMIKVNFTLRKLIFVEETDTTAAAATVSSVSKKRKVPDDVVYTPKRQKTENEGNEEEEGRKKKEEDDDE